MIPAVTFSDSRWSNQVRTMIDTLGVEKIPFLRDQLRLLLLKIITFTPPKSKAQGMQAVASDISRSFQSFNVTAFRDKRLKAIVDRKDYRAFDNYMRHVENDKLRGARAMPFSEQLIGNARDNRGRIRRKSLKTFFLGSSDRKTLQEYTKRKKANVGTAKNGWLAALKYVGGTTPAWISRHGSDMGSVIPILEGDRPSLTAINSTPWANNKSEGERIVRNAMESRVNAMRTHLKKLVELARQKAGLGG